MTRPNFERAASPCQPAVLVLADGAVFEGKAIGKLGLETPGEVVFQTSMTGYPELLTDPSYYGQLLTFTYPEIGNYGVQKMDFEGPEVHAAGLICRHFSSIDSNWRSDFSLNEWLIRANKAGITDIDTRALVRHLRTEGSTMGILSTQPNYDLTVLWQRAKALPSMAGQDLAQKVTCTKTYTFEDGLLDLEGAPIPNKRPNKKHVVVMDFGIKRNILRLLVHYGCKVTVMPAQTTAAAILALKPDGVFLSNGPGDPATMAYAVKNVRALVGQVPIFGICMGHQILAQALGGKTYKMLFGHRGANQPVRHGDRVLITSQNHGFALDTDSIKDKAIEHSQINISDGTSEGITFWDQHVFSVQYHPEGAPGPHDACDHFERFVALMGAFHGSKTVQPNKVVAAAAN